MCIQEIRKEKELENSKNDKEFDEYNNPESFSNSHIFKTIVVEIKYLFNKFSHGVPENRLPTNVLYVLILCIKLRHFFEIYLLWWEWYF
jgi:hypothetical protein